MPTSHLVKQYINWCQQGDWMALSQNLYADSLKLYWNGEEVAQGPESACAFWQQKWNDLPGLSLSLLTTEVRSHQAQIVFDYCSRDAHGDPFDCTIKHKLTLSGSRIVMEHIEVV